MKNLIASICLLLTVFGHAQNCEEQIAALQSERDSLLRELDKCRNPLYSALFELSEQEVTHPAEPVISHEEMETRLMAEIKNASPENLAKAEQAVELAQEFSAFVDLFRDKLIDYTGGMDEVLKRPVNIKEKELTGQFLLEQGNATELKKRLVQLRSAFLELADEDEEVAAELKTGDFSFFLLSNRDSWEEFKFYRMPLAAVLPILSQMKSYALTDEVVVLNYLNGK